jgi:hypothetical protein
LAKLEDSIKPYLLSFDKVLLAVAALKLARANVDAAQAARRSAVLEGNHSQYQLGCLHLEVDLKLDELRIAEAEKTAANVRFEIEYRVEAGDADLQARVKVCSAEDALKEIVKEAERKEEEAREKVHCARMVVDDVVARLKEFGVADGSREFPLVLE